MNTIYKYSLSEGQGGTISMPKGAKIIKAAFQLNNLCIWAIVDPTFPKVEDRIFKILATGEAYKNEWNHIETLFLEEGRVVLHLFEILQAIEGLADIELASRKRGKKIAGEQCTQPKIKAVYKFKDQKEEDLFEKMLMFKPII